ncbi:hypothetical protein B4O97_08910 [Marispirochaeta aestuarii]|uniref:Uncharacterized protein n=1 Tax=Marispirochaeta aestuarii TaxID=1963862 RepID=A0A1Y1S017_9SPIO|nr:hypothetical protein [Marispirochaeta aestuarii]ORC35747.1 hypothetical protein B4O97_08910 [Marispirochaeta aestuarii]
MERTDSYLYKAVRGDENSVTELLCNLIRRKYILNIVLKEIGLSEEEINSIAYNDIKTQKSMHIGIPDIIIENSETLILFEIKTSKSREFEKTQIFDYPDFVKKEKQRKKFTKLVYLIPMNHIETEVVEQVQKEYSDKLIRIVYWESLLGRLIEEDIDKDHPINNEILRYISGVVIHSTPNFKLSRQEVVLMFNQRDLGYAASILDKWKKQIALIKVEITDYLNLNTNYSWKAGGEQFDSYGWGQYFDVEKPYKGYFFVGFNLIYDEFIFAVSIPKEFSTEISKGLKFENEGEYFIPITKYTIIDDDFENNLKVEIKNILDKHFAGIKV